MDESTDILVMEEANLRNQSTHVETVAQTDRLINMGRKKGRARKKRMRNIKVKCTVPCRIYYMGREKGKRGRTKGIRPSANTLSSKNEFRSKWGPSITINHLNGGKNRDSISDEWIMAQLQEYQQDAAADYYDEEYITDDYEGWQGSVPRRRKKGAYQGISMKKNRSGDKPIKRKKGKKKLKHGGKQIPNINPSDSRMRVTNNARSRKKNKKRTQDRTRSHRYNKVKKLYLKHVPIKVVSTQKALAIAVDELLSYNPSYLGIDCEWKPQFRKNKKQNKVSLLQIAHNKLIILIRLNHLKRVYHSLSTSGMLKILHSRNIIKCGVGIMDDQTKMYDDHGVNIERCIELNDLNMSPIHTRSKPGPYLSLAKLCHKVLRCEMQYKSKKITMSNWESDVLSDKQIMYAADDALTGYEILKKLLKLNHRMGSVRTLLRNIDDYMDRKLVDHSLETCRDEMTRIAQYYTYFPLYDLDDIHWELFGYGMKKKHNKKMKQLVAYFDDIFEIEKSTRVVYSKIYY
eukprot:359824_1